MAAALTALSTVRPNSVVDASPFRSLEASKSLSSSASMATSPLRSIPVLRKSVSAGPKSSTIQAISVSDMSAPAAVSDKPMKEIPGTYGFPFFGAIKDRLDFFWFQGVPKFYEARRDKYQSTVFRTNVPPGPPFFPDPRVVMLLDESSYPALFNLENVLKKDVFVGTFVPSVKLTGGYRILSYLDPSEPKHAPLKQFAFDIIKASLPRFVPTFNESMAEVFAKWDAAFLKDGKVAFATDLQPGTFKFVLKSFTKRDPYEEGEASMGSNGPLDTTFWLLGTIAPITGIPVPWFLAPLVELFLHTFPIPFIFVKSQYNKLVNFYKTWGTELLDIAEKQLGLDRDEALHNLIFLVTFNCWGGVNILFPSIIKRLATTSAEYQTELAAEVRKAVAKNGGQLGFKALADMPLVESALYEVMRIDPPVPYQYATAKKDFVIQSHDASFQIKKGETIAGFMPVATRDPKIFDDAESYVPKRFVGDEGKALLKYVLWSNGPQTEDPSLSNKHCAGKHIILNFGQLFIASLFLKYDKMQVDATDSSTLSTLKSAAS